MVKIYFSIIISMLFIYGCCNDNHKCDENKFVETIIGQSDYLISGTLWIQRSAEYRANCYQTFKYAKLVLESNFKNTSKDKPSAVVLDIDETVLDNSYFQVNLIESNASYSSESWKDWTDMKCATAVPGAIDFLEFTKSLGVKIVYISNRKEHEKESTIENMKKLGFPDVISEDIVFRKEGEKSSKIERRNQISERYNIILLVGDNLADFDGVFEDRTENFGFNVVDINKDMFGEKYIVLPNPMYGNWDDVISDDRKAALIGYYDICTK